VLAAFKAVGAFNIVKLAIKKATVCADGKAC
jgi:hypothetical protein